MAHRLICDSSAVKPVFAWVPSQLGLLEEEPHLHNATTLLPSTFTMHGSFLTALIIIFGIDSIGLQEFKFKVEI